MCASAHIVSIAGRGFSLSAVWKRVSCGLIPSAPADCQLRRGDKRGLLTLMVPGDGGLTSKVANAGEPVSPALISPPSPLERLRMRGFSALLCPPRGANLSSEDKSGKASVAVMFRDKLVASSSKEFSKAPVS